MNSGALSADDLVRACAQGGDSAAWEEFVRRFHRLIATVVLRVARRWDAGPSPNVIDDLVQDTYLKLCADNCQMLRNFQPRHPDAFYGYLKVVAANLARDHFKAQMSAKRGAGVVTVTDDSALDPTTTPRAPEEDPERRILLKEVYAALHRRVQGPHLQRDLQVFRLYYREGLTATAIAALPFIGLSAKGVESTILRLTRMLREEMAGGRGPQGVASS